MGIRQLLTIAGPGLITGAADDDPSGIATYVQTGTQFGYGQLWTALFALPLMTAVQEASARIGIVTGKGLAAVMRERYGGRLVSSIILLLLAVPVLAGSSAYAVAEVSGWSEGLNLKLDKARSFYGIIALGMLVGLLINFVGINPIKLLVIAAVINGVIAAPIIAVLALLAASKQIMGHYRSGWLSNTLIWLACLGMAAAAVGLLLSTL
jgi:Mn2+/Fe2+ NRAMP family transporter